MEKIRVSGETDRSGWCQWTLFKKKATGKTPHKVLDPYKQG